MNTDTRSAQHTTPDTTPANATRTGWIDQRRGLLLVCLYGLAHFAYTWWSHPLNPIWRANIDTGWYGWIDQVRYVNGARYIFENFTGSWSLPLSPGYSLLAGPFLWLLPADPFVIPDALLYVLTLGLYFWLFRRLLSAELSLLALVMLSQGDQFLDFFVEPWSNVVTTVVLAVLLVLALQRTRRPLLAAALVGFLMSWVLAARYGDVVLIFPVALLALYTQGTSWPQRVRLALVGAVAALPLVVWLGWLHTELYGSPLETLYAEALSPLTGAPSQDVAARSWRYFGYHLFSLLINPLPFVHEIRFSPALHSLWDRALLSYYFVIVLAGVGLWFISRGRRLFVAAFGCSLGLALLYYGTFWSTSGNDLKFHALRFFSPWQPMLVGLGMAGAVALLRADWQQRADRRMVIGGLALPLGFGLLLYLLGLWWQPFPDTARLVPSARWNAWSDAQGQQAATTLTHDQHVGMVWQAEGVQPAGTSYTVDMQRVYDLEALFLGNPQGQRAAPGPVALELSLDGQRWFVPPQQTISTPQARLLGFHFPPTAARFARFVLQAETSAAGWQIGEVYAYGERAPVSFSLDAGWYPAEEHAGVRYRWMLSPAQLDLQTSHPARVLLRFQLHNAAHPQSTIDVLIGGVPVASFTVEPGQRVRVGPLPVPAGNSQLELRVHEENVPVSALGTPGDERRVNLALSDLHIVYVGRQ